MYFRTSGALLFARDRFQTVSPEALAGEKLSVLHRGRLDKKQAYNHSLLHELAFADLDVAGLIWVGGQLVGSDVPAVFHVKKQL